MAEKKLYRSKKNRIIAGVCGGIAEFLDTDPTAIRLAWVLLTLFTGFFPGVLGYLIAWIVVPEKK
jgi:phage shock protein C